MSRRFGRNQKRHMREALAVEVQRVEETAKLAARRLEMFHSVRHELNELKSFFESVAQRVGRESILAAGMPVVEMPELGRSSFRRPIFPEFLATYRVGLDNVPQMSKAMYAVMHLLEVQAVRDAFKMQIVAHVSFDDNVVGVAYSEDFVRKSTEAELVNQITRDLPYYLAREMKRAK